MGSPGMENGYYYEADAWMDNAVMGGNASGRALAC